MADKKDKKLTVKEFRYWLEGVEEMQEDDWSPDVKQWKRIREKIAMLDDVTTTNTFAEVVPVPPVMVPGMVSFPANVNPHNPLESMNINPSQFPAPTGPSPTGPFLHDDLARPARTPNIDTGPGKPYKSSFA
jgi:hypothetical protein